VRGTVAVPSARAATGVTAAAADPRVAVPAGMVPASAAPAMVAAVAAGAATIS